MVGFSLEFLMTLDNTGVENHNVYTQILDHWYYLEIISDHFTGLDHYSKKKSDNTGVDHPITYLQNEGS